MTITDKDKETLLKIQNYFGEHDTTPFEHWAFGALDALLSKPDEEKKPEQRTYTHAEVCDLLDTFMKLVDLIDTDPDEAKRRIEAAQARLASRAPVAPSPDQQKPDLFGEINKKVRESYEGGLRHSVVPIEHVRECLKAAGIEVVDRPGPF